jgi:predicted transcriptional regulator
MENVSKEKLHELIEALPETEAIAAKRFLEFLLSLREGEEYFSSEDLAEIDEGFAQIRRGEVVNWDDFKKRHNL